MAVKATEAGGIGGALEEVSLDSYLIKEANKTAKSVHSLEDEDDYCEGLRAQSEELRIALLNDSLKSQERLMDVVGLKNQSLN